MNAAKIFVAGPAANILCLSLRGEELISEYSGSAKAPNGSGPAISNPKLRTRIPWALACIPCPYS